MDCLSPNHLLHDTIYYTTVVKHDQRKQQLDITASSSYVILYEPSIRPKSQSVELANIHNYYYKHYKEASCTVKLVYTYIQSLYTNWCTYISINSLSTVKLDYKVLQSICKPV